MADPGIAAMSCFFLLGIDTGITVEKASIKMKRLVSVLRKFRKQCAAIEDKYVEPCGYARVLCCVPDGISPIKILRNRENYLLI